MQAHSAEADSDILSGVGRNVLTSGVKVTDDASLVTAGGISKVASLAKRVVRILFASCGIEERGFSDETVL